jgi:hypothetical protein
MVFGQLWEQTSCRKIIAQLAKGRGFGFSIERAILASVLHRLAASSLRLRTPRVNLLEQKKRVQIVSGYAFECAKIIREGRSEAAVRVWSSWSR